MAKYRADLLFIIDSIAVPDLFFFIKDTLEKRRKADEGTGQEQNELIKFENH
jgi:hypothetical protein